MKRIISIFSALLLLTLFSGCTQMGVNMGAPVFSRMIDKLGNTKSLNLVRDGIAGDILIATAVTEISPNNLRLLKECSYLYFTHGLLVEDKDTGYAKEMYLIGRDYGMRALSQNRGFRKGLRRGEPVHRLVGGLGKKYAPALCWTSLNAGMWVLQNLDDPAAFMEMADIIAMARRSVELDEDYFHSVAKAFLGCYYAMVPKALDPSCGPENSTAMFAEARETDNGAMLLYDVFEARFLAAGINDEKAFHRLLEGVLTVDSGILKDGYLFNELAKDKARYYLENKEKFF